ncbi:MAG: 16S rRNA (guanine(527)-N(7))-methyltransferase RsmG [Actinobacteria bacterium]|nr:16S rRNA (guanine(527)-N(7))-methyltransferase RsmG [Actinomycetota bacterium]
MTDDASYCAQLAAGYRLDALAAERFLALAGRCVALEISGTAIRSRDEALRLHVADSLAGLEIDAIRRAESLCDIGTGVGFPGIVLAIARPELQVTLVDAVRKKVEAATALARALEIQNVECVWSRAESIGATGSPARESFDVVTARALAPLTVLVEYAGPLLKPGGTLVAWKGTPDQDELADATAAEAALGFGAGELIETRPFAGSRGRHLYVATKHLATSDRFPRREGVALRKSIKAR